MAFGKNFKSDVERVAHSMVENQWRDTQPSAKPIIGSEEMIMKLRPLEKNKHVSKQTFRNGGVAKS